MGLAVFLSFKIPVLITTICASSAQKFGILLVSLLNSSSAPKNSVEDTWPGKHTNIAIENMAILIVSFPIKNGGSFRSYVCLPEGI
jgi:hypothetical protein